MGTDAKNAWVFDQKSLYLPGRSARRAAEENGMEK